MKKTFIMAVFTVIAAFMTNAAQVNWTVSNVIKDGAKLDKGTYITYLFNVKDIASADALASAKAGTLDVSKAINSSTGKGPGATGNSGVNTEYMNPASETLYAVIFDSLDPTKGNFIVTQEVTQTIKAVGATTFGFGSQAGKPWIPVDAVPEPTTMALVALGLAAFGLKRKIA